MNIDRFVRSAGWGSMFRLLVAAGIVVLILRSLDLSAFRQVMVAPQWEPLLAMMVAALAFRLLGTAKIWIMLSAFAPVRLGTVLRDGFVALSLGTFTPASVGDFSLVTFLRREGIPVHQGLSAMVVDRGVTLAFTVLVYLPITLVLVAPGREWWWLPVGCAAVLGVGLGVNLVPSFRRKLLQFLVRPLLPRLEDFLRATSELLRRHPMRVLANVGVTFVRSIVSGIAIALGLLAAGSASHLSGSHLVWVVALTNSLNLLNALPISVRGIGVYEGGALVAFSLIGLHLQREHVFAAFVFLRAYVVLSSLLVLVIVTPFMRIRAPVSASVSAERQPRG